MQGIRATGKPRHHYFRGVGAHRRRDGPVVPVAGCGNEKTIIRRSFCIEGIVQGVGFRPFVFHLAHKLGLTGWVRNTPAGVEIEVQGRETELAAFERALNEETPPLAVISSTSSTVIPSNNDAEFVI